MLFVVYQRIFAALTPALVSGAFAERMSFQAYLLSVRIWSTLVYDSLAQWVWAAGSASWISPLAS